MLKQLTFTALASALVLAIPAVTPASAFSRGAHYGHARNFGHGNHGHHQHFATRGYFGHRLRVVRVPERHHHYHWWHWRHGSHGHYGFYGDYAARPVYGAETAVAPAGTCNCLFKEYLQDGSVVFTDRCTKESAIAAPLPATPRG